MASYLPSTLQSDWQTSSNSQPVLGSAPKTPEAVPAMPSTSALSHPTSAAANLQSIVSPSTKAYFSSSRQTFASALQTILTTPDSEPLPASNFETRLPDFPVDLLKLSNLAFPQEHFPDTSREIAELTNELDKLKIDESFWIYKIRDRVLLGETTYLNSAFMLFASPVVSCGFETVRTLDFSVFDYTPEQLMHIVVLVRYLCLAIIYHSFYMCCYS
jgi:hypothetical protein